MSINSYISQKIIGGGGQRNITYPIAAQRGAI